MGKHPETIEIPADAPNMARKLIGHETQWRRLQEAFSAGHGGHGYILTGAQGIGKATFAFQAARQLLASGDADAEAMERTGRLVSALAHPDLLVLDSGRDTSKRPIVPVEDVRRAVQFLSRTAAGSGRRVVIVDKADHLNRNAANALLKILEEPPSGAVLFLVCDRAGRLLPTLRSRCQMLRFAPLEISGIDAVLDDLASREVLQCDTAARERAIILANGSPGVAMRILQNDLIPILTKIDGWLDPGQSAKPIESQKLAATLAPRDSHQAYALAMERLRSHLLSQARDQADRRQRVAVAQLWTEIGQRESEVDAFNLDRMPFILWALNAAREVISTRHEP
jgi:DNA polymerase-3 subunit delta'